jgi:glycosyltransferase involved in cell wall biosynthesis
MRVACIATSQVPSRTANSIQVMKVCQALADLGHDLQLWLPGRAPRVAWEELAADYGLHASFPIHWLPAIPQLRHYDFCLWAVLSARRWQPDLVYVWPLQAAALSAGLGLPTLLEVHDRPAGRMGPRLLGRFLNGRGARRLLPTTAALQAWLAAFYCVELRPPFSIVSPNGVDLERYDRLPSPADARRNLGLTEGFTAGYTGHLYAGRGIGLILDLAGRNPDIRFVLAGGESAAVDEWRQRAEQAGLVNIAFLGFFPNDRLPLVQAACDVLLMPYERHIAVSGGGDTSDTASPMKVFEYMAAGRPILSSDLPVVRELLDEQTAVLLPPQDVNAWNEGLRQLRGDAKRCAALSRQAARAVVEHSWTARSQRALEGLEETHGR